MEKQEPSSSSSSSKSKINQKLSSIIKDKNCPICLTLISDHHRPAIITNCLHVYCFRCLLRWSHYKTTCPLCNSPFNSFFFTSSPSSSSFHLRSLSLCRPSSGPTHVPARRFQFPLQRRQENRRWRPVQRRRSFGQGSVPSEVVAQRILQWRVSVYKEGLSAVPFPEKDRHILNFPVNRESVIKKIEPWIQRELRAILQDPDPTIIVHVATSLFLTRIEKQAEDPSTSANNEDAFLEPLRRFLYEDTDSFWHELRCFAESPYIMHVYDEVIEYRKSR